MQQITTNAVAERRNVPTIVEFREQLYTRTAEYAAALPAHIKPEFFQRATVTAMAQNPNLLRADRRSLWLALIRCAQDGLIPDGRQAVLTIFKTRDRDGEMHELVAYMPMIAGIRVRVQNSGEISRFEQTIVYANDQFEIRLGDRPGIFHKPTFGPRGQPIAAYSVAQFRDGTLSREWMTVDEIEAVRRMSRNSDDGPWRKWWSEMARKTVARRHSKVLPMSSELVGMLDRAIGVPADTDTDALQITSAAGPTYPTAEEGRPLLSDRLDRLAAEHVAESPSTDRPIQGAERSGRGRPRGSRDTRPRRRRGDEAAASGAPADGDPIEEMIGPGAELDAGHDPDTGEVIEQPATPANETAAATGDTAAAQSAPAANVGDSPAGTSPVRASDAGNDADFERGFRDARAGWKNCLNREISSDPRRLAAWNAGQKAYEQQEGKPR